MGAPSDLADDGPGIAAAVLTVGFGTTVAMGAVGYVGRLPAVLLPGPVLLGLLLLTLVGGGFYAGRHSPEGWKAGLGVGALAGLLNLLALGGFLSGGRPDGLTPSALLWVPGSVGISALLAAVGATLARGAGTRPATVEWQARFVKVATGATLLLLAVGGLVFGALVGLTTLILAIFTQRVESRSWVRRMGWLALALVIAQGTLGGLRLTLSTSPADLSPSLGLVIAHGVLGQVFFALLVGLGVVTSATWRSDPEPERRDSVLGDRVLGVVLVALVLVQLTLGAAQRHLASLLMIHIVTGVAVIAPTLMHVGIRALSLNPRTPLLRKLGLALLGALLIQVGLGLAAFVVSRATADGVLAATWDVTTTTAHQWFGAVVLALSVALMCWNFKLLAPER